MTDTPPDIVVPAAFANALRLLDRHFIAANDLLNALIAINQHGVDLEDDAIAEIESAKDLHAISTDTIVNALAVECENTDKHFRMHVLNATELHNRQCKCGARVVIEEVK